MKYVLSLLLLSLLAGTLLTTGSCKKKQFSSNGNLAFSVDTLVFDTVFTTVGSTTGQFKVYNPDNKKLTIEQIELMGGSSSPFRMNFDGLIGTQFSDIEIEGGDSLFCFVEVTLSVNGGTLPMIVEDSIRFRSNGTDQYVKLAVWGQDAYFHYNDVPLNDTTWSNDKPHVIYGVSAVNVGNTLTIPAGTDVYLHKQSALYVYRGTLNIEGTATEKVTFQGDRLESFYDNVPGQYYGIYLDSAVNCSIEHAEIKNAIAGIHIESKLAGSVVPTLTIKNTEIWNCGSYGMLVYDEPKVVAENLLVHSNAIHALIVLGGCDLDFTHCDLLGYGGGDGTYPAVGMRNYFTSQGSDFIQDIHVNFKNCVIYGSGDEELVMDTESPSGQIIDFNYRNCLINIEPSADAIYTSCLFNNSSGPVFKDIAGDDFTFWSTSALRDNANAAFQTTGNTDLLGNVRGALPDIGVHEYQ